MHPTVPNGVFVALKIMYNTGLSSTGSIQQRYSMDFAVLQKLPRHRNINRFVTEFVDLPPDAVFDELSPDLKEVGSRVNLVTGRAHRLRAQFYVVELHDMTLEAALKRFPVSAQSSYPAPYSCLASFTPAYPVADLNPQVGPRPLEWVLTVLLHVAEALSAALAANVVHMDLKTDNIMIDDAVTFAAGPVPEWYVATAMLT